jgi:hypothetical protein
MGLLFSWLRADIPVLRRRALKAGGIGRTVAAGAPGGGGGAGPCGMLAAHVNAWMSLE